MFAIQNTISQVFIFFKYSYLTLSVSNYFPHMKDIFLHMVILMVKSQLMRKYNQMKVLILKLKNSIGIKGLILPISTLKI